VFKACTLETVNSQGVNYSECQLTTNSDTYTYTYIVNTTELLHNY